MKVEIDKTNQIENGCVIVVENYIEHTESYFLVLKENVSNLYYLVNTEYNMIVGKYDSLETLKRNLDDYRIIKTIPSDNVILKLKE